MGMALGWMALALSVVGAPDNGRGGVPIKYTVRFVDLEGLGWRDAVFTRLTPVTRQGSATIWTAPGDVAGHMIAVASKCPATKTTQAPTVTAWTGMPAHIATRDSRQLVTQVSFHNDGRPARTETVRTGTTATVVGRKIDQGILVQMALADTQILAVHGVGVGGRGDAPSDPSAKQTAYRADACEGATDCCAAAKADVAKAAGRVGGGLPEGRPIVDDVRYLVEVPEIGSQEIAGEWLIPNDGILLVSFGPHTIADKDGKAVIRERLAIVEAAEADGEAPAPRAAMWGAPAMFGAPMAAPPVILGTPMPAGAPVMAVNPAPSPYNAPAPVAATPVAPMPPMPSRSIPQGYHSDGKAADLPPLPPDEADSDEADDDSAEPRPSPQKKAPRQQPAEARPAGPRPAPDTAMRKAQFSIPNFPAIPTLFQPAPTVGLQFLLPIKPVSLKLPFNRRLEVEIYGRVVRAPEPAGNMTDIATTKSGSTTK